MRVRLQLFRVFAAALVLGAVLHVGTLLPRVGRLAETLPAGAWLFFTSYALSTMTALGACGLAVLLLWKASHKPDGRAEMVPREPPPATLRELFDKYLRERTPAKGRSKQKHDRLAERVWAAFFDAQEPSRRMDRRVETLDRTDWERFIEWRREGKIAGWERRVRNKQIKHDLDFLVSVLNWATGQKENGHPILRRNPWDGSIRRAQGWVKPKVQNQKRPAMTDEVRQKLIEHSPSWQLAAALRLGRLTGRRNNAVRQLLWSDIDLQETTVTWSAEKDKTGRETVTLLRAEAVDLLKGLPSRGIGNAPVFPSEGNPAVPTSSDTFQTWLQRAKKSLLRATEDETERKRWEIKLAWPGYHAEKRAYVRDPKFRKLDAKVQEILTGTDVSTLRRIHDEVSIDDQRAEWARVGLG